MPRQIKKNLDFFYLDCDIFSKTSDLRPLLRRYKADGLAVFIHILCDVYSTEGYYFKPDDFEDYVYDISEDCGITAEKVKLIISFMQDRTLLDAFSLDKNTVFTSHGIQKHYAEAMKGRKRSVAEIKGDYWILTEKEEAEIDTFYKGHSYSDKSEINDDKSEINDDKSEIYSTKEIKGNKRKLYSPQSPRGDKQERDREADKKTDKERFYAARRNTAIAEAEKAKRIAEQDEAYKSAAKLVKQTQIQILKAERTAPHTVPELQRTLEEARLIRTQALKRLNLTEDDFIPKYACEKCSDTGYMADGTPCDCYQN